MERYQYRRLKAQFHSSWSSLVESVGGVVLVGLIITYSGAAVVVLLGTTGVVDALVVVDACRAVDVAVVVVVVGG